MSGRTGGTARITERRLKPTSVIKVQTITLRQVTVMRPSPEVDALFFTRVSKPGRYNRTRYYFTISQWMVAQLPALANHRLTLHSSFILIKGSIRFEGCEYDAISM